MQPIPLFVCVFLIEYTNSKSKTTQFLINNKNYIMNTTKSTGVETVNSLITPKGMQRTLQVEVFENGNVDIDFTIKGKDIDGELTQMTRIMTLNRREVLALIFYLVRIILPNKFLANKWKREEKEREEKKD